MRLLLIPALLLASTALHADWKQDMKDAAKTKAGGVVEQKLGLPSAAPQGAAAYFTNLKTGDTVKSPVLVQFGLKNAGVAPAGTQIAGTGHHHLLIDDPTVDLTVPLPMTDQIKHFGGGQTETSVTLKPGKHTLQLVFGDWKHQSFNPTVASEKITITVQ